jgi:hypothetical protein
MKTDVTTFSQTDLAIKSLHLEVDGAPGSRAFESELLYRLHVHLATTDGPKSLLDYLYECTKNYPRPIYPL